MKTKSIFLKLLLSTAMFVFLLNCSGNKKEAIPMESHDSIDNSSSNETEPTGKPQFEVDSSFQQQLALLFNSYLPLKDAFVASDISKVKSKALAANQALSKVDMNLLSGAAHNDWMTYSSAIQTSLKDIETGTEVEAQRKAFQRLSDNVYKSIKAFGLGGKDAFYEFCPMAFNNEGGYWLSDKEQIQNPYLGEKMPTCGSVVEKLN